tara:strand:+ start:566 stop:1042 length:477 start_codon:yes stop_codon:yes gene_type:complete
LTTPLIAVAMKKFKHFFIEKQVLGLIEFFDVDGVGKIPSKLDSGNGAFNVIHGEDIQIQGNKVLFKTVNNKHLIKDKVDDISINVGAGNIEERPVVNFDLKIGNKEFKDIPFSVGNRTSNLFKILVSKDFIEKELDALIDVSRENIADKELDATFNTK